MVRGYGLDKLARLVRWFATPMLICALVILALPLWLLLAWDEPVLSLVTGSGDNLFLCILSEWIAIYMSFRSFSSFFALRRRLRAGKEPRRSGWRCSARINAACLAGSFILVALSFAVLAAGRGMRWEGETATVNRPFPDFALEELEGRPRLEAAPSVWSVERRGVDLDNYVRFDWSVLAPEQYEVERNMADGDYETSFRLDWYRLSLPALAEPFARDLFSRHTFYAEIPERYTVAPLDVPDTDAVLITEEGGFGQDVLLCRGTVVFYLRYYGDQELSAHPSCWPSWPNLTGGESMAHHNTVRRYPPVDYYDVVAVDRWLERMALNLHDGPYAACLLYDGSGELGRFSARSARWSLGD